MSGVTTALATLKTAIAASLSPAPAYVYTYPADYADIARNLKPANLPFVVVQQVVNTPMQWHFLNLHRWQAEILHFLKEGPVTNDKTAAAAETGQNDHVKGMADVLQANVELSGDGKILTVDEILFDYQIGHIHWETAVYWGVRYVVTIQQTPAQL